MKYHLPVILVAGAVFWAGCDPTLDETRVEPTTNQPTRTPVETAAEDNESGVVDVNNVRSSAERIGKEGALAGVEQAVSDLDARMEELSNTAEQGVADGKAELQTALTELREQRAQLDVLMERMREASGNAWEEVQREFRVAYQEFLSTLEETEGKLRG
jgi:hypothetical protein